MAEENDPTMEKRGSTFSDFSESGASLGKRSSALNVPLPAVLLNEDDDRKLVTVDMYKQQLNDSDQEEVVDSGDKDPLEGVEAQKMGDPITSINPGLWKPVLDSYEFFHFEDTKRLQLLSKTTEFFQFIHKHLVDETCIIDSKFPRVTEWRRRTSIWVDWKGKNNVTNITKALNDCHNALTRQLNYIRNSRIICIEDKVGTPLIRFDDMILGDRTFRVGNYAVATPTNFFLGKRTYQSDDWRGALSKHHPARTLMQTVSIFEHGEQPEPGDPMFNEYKRLLEEAEEEKMHNLCLAEYAASLRLDLTNASKKTDPLRITWEDIKKQLLSSQKKKPNSKIMESLQNSFQNVEYIINAPYKKLPPLMKEKETHLLSSPIIWLDSFTKLLNDRAGALFALKNAIMEFLRGRRKKEKTLKGKTRICVEELQVDVDEESRRMTEVIQNLRIPFNAFDEFYTK